MVDSWVKSNDIDIFSPQLYTSGREVRVRFRVRVRVRVRVSVSVSVNVRVS